MSDAGGGASLERLATEWLAAEEAASAHAAGGERAPSLGLAYEQALAVATLEEKRLAWEGARTVQAAAEMGSKAWAAARRVSELLRVEYVIAKELEDAREA